VKQLSPAEVQQFARDLWKAYRNPSDESEVRIKLLLPILAVAAGPEIAAAAQAAVSYFKGACATDADLLPRVSMARFRGFGREVRNVVEKALGKEWINQQRSKNV
jgi:hypothetical protein